MSGIYGNLWWSSENSVGYDTVRGVEFRSILSHGHFIGKIGANTIILEFFAIAAVLEIETFAQASKITATITPTSQHVAREFLRPTSNAKKKFIVHNAPVSQVVIVSKTILKLARCDVRKDCRQHKWAFCNWLMKVSNLQCSDKGTLS